MRSVDDPVLSMSVSELLSHFAWLPDEGLWHFRLAEDNHCVFCMDCLNRTDKFTTLLQLLDVSGFWGMTRERAIRAFRRHNGNVELMETSADILKMAQERI